MAEVAPTSAVDPTVTPAPVVTPPAAPVAEVKPAGAPVAEAPKTLLTESEVPAEPKEGKKPPAEATAPFDLKQLSLPEGLKADDPQLVKFGEIIGNDKLSPKERGDNLLSLYAEGVKAVGEANTKLWNDLQSQWRDEIKADPEIGGDKLKPTLQTISRALDTALGAELAPKFRLALDFTGAGNNPHIAKGLAKMAAILTEGAHIPGEPSSTKKTIGSVFFDNSPEFSEQKGNG